MVKINETEVSMRAAAAFLDGQAPPPPILTDQERERMDLFTAVVNRASELGEKLGIDTKPPASQDFQEALDYLGDFLAEESVGKALLKDVKPGNLSVGFAHLFGFSIIFEGEKFYANGVAIHVNQQFRPGFLIQLSYPQIRDSGSSAKKLTQEEIDRFNRLREMFLERPPDKIQEFTKVTPSGTDISFHYSIIGADFRGKDLAVINRTAFAQQFVAGVEEIFRKVDYKMSHPTEEITLLGINLSKPPNEMPSLDLMLALTTVV